MASSTTAVSQPHGSSSHHKQSSSSSSSADKQQIKATKQKCHPSSKSLSSSKSFKWPAPTMLLSAVLLPLHSNAHSLPDSSSVPNQCLQCHYWRSVQSVHGHHGSSVAWTAQNVVQERKK
eukprot:4764968-Ditylum_brightwellii.AAC.1